MANFATENGSAKGSTVMHHNCKIGSVRTSQRLCIIIIVKLRFRSSDDLLLMSTPPPGGNVGATSSARSLDQKVLIQNALGSSLPTPAAKESHSVDQLYEASPQVKKEVRLVHCELSFWVVMSNQMSV